MANATVSALIGHPSVGSTTRCRGMAAQIASTTRTFDARSTSDAARRASELMMLVPASCAAGAVAALVVRDLSEGDEVVRRQPEPCIPVDESRLEHAFRHASNSAG